MLLAPLGNLIAQEQESIKSIEALKKAIHTAEKLQENQEYYKAMDIAQRAKVDAMYYDDPISLSRIYKIIGYSYEVNGEFLKSYQNYNKALIHSKLSGNNKFVTEMYSSLARLSTSQKQPIEETVKLYQNVIDYADISQDTLKILSANNKIAQLYLLEKSPNNALFYLQKSEQYGSENNIEYIRLNYLYAYYHLQRQEIQQADYFLDIALDESKKQEMPLDIADLYKISSLIHHEKSDYRSAYADLIKYNTAQKNILTQEKLKELNLANAQFEVENYKTNLEQIKGDIKKKNSQITQWETSIFLACIILVIGLAFLISSIRNNIVKKRLNNDLINKNKELLVAKEAAEQVSHLKSQFVSTVSHELRTPLYGVIGLTQLLRENPDSENRKEYLDSLKFSGDYLLALINDVLQLSKIETKDIVVENAPFNLKILVDSIVKSLHNKRHKNNNTVHMEIDPLIDSVVIGDSVRLSQIIINLVGNSLKFTKHGNVWIQITKETETKTNYQLKFIIKDDGIGIPKEKQKTIFENFEQIKHVDQEYQGTGLGLSIVKKLIDLYESEIIVESEEGKGAQFSFTLPFERSEQNPLEVPSEDKYSDIGTTTKLDILIVDDNKINQIVTKNILDKRGYTTTVCGNGLEAIEAAKMTKFDLILMDVNMPGMGGLEATERIRKFDTRTPIIALTAVEEQEVIEQAMVAGMNDLIVKPYDTHIFYQTIIKNIKKPNEETIKP